MTFGSQEHRVLVPCFKLDDLIALEGQFNLLGLLVVTLGAKAQLPEVALSPGVQALESFRIHANLSQSQTMKTSSRNLSDLADSICIFDEELDLDWSVEAIWLLVVEHAALSLVERAGVGGLTAPGPDDS